MAFYAGTESKQELLNKRNRNTKLQKINYNIIDPTLDYIKNEILYIGI